MELKPGFFRNNHSLLSESRLSLFLISLTLSACGGGGSSSIPAPEPPRNPCNTNQLQKDGGGCVSAASIDITNNGKPDGLDLNNDAVPELIYLTNSVTPNKKQIDVNGDGLTDYYLIVDGSGKKELHLNPNSTIANNDDLVFIVTDAKGAVTGFNNDEASRTKLNDIYNDATKPTVAILPNAGLYQSAPIPVITCTDDVACNAIAYTVNGSTPAFDANSTVVIGKTATITLPATAVASYNIQFISRDSNGNTSVAVRTAAIDVDVNACSNKPVAVFSDTNVKFGTSGFTLDGSKSVTTNGSAISKYIWTQVVMGDEANAVISFSDKTIAKPAIKIPVRVSTLTFALIVEDQAKCRSDVVKAKVYVMRDPISGKAIYVDGNAGKGNDATGLGTRLSPMASIAATIAKAPGADIYLTSLLDPTASYKETATITLTNGVSIFGGYDSNWVRNVKKHLSKITSSAATGVEFKQVDLDAWMSGLDLKVAMSTINGSDVYGVKQTSVAALAKLTIRDNNITTGNAAQGTIQTSIKALTGSNYGIYSDEIEKLEVVNNIITVGNGGDGNAKNAALQTRVGKNGASGLKGQCQISRGSILRRPKVPPAIIKLGGAGGGNFAAISGGNGGFNSNKILVIGNKGKNGKNQIASCTTLGGQQASNLTINGNDSNCDLGVIAIAGKDAILAGKNFGTINTGRYMAAQGNPGISNGVDGKNGGGGGGGSGTFRSNNSLFKKRYYFGSGASGGGGGSKGFRGQLAVGGGGGGASFGIYLVNPSTIAIVTVSSNTILTRVGGTGSFGGNGSPGTAGGIGGSGGSAVPCLSLTGAGGRGQNGIAGSRGGDGSGGGGGPSIGILYKTGSLPSISNNTITSGISGVGGNSRNAPAGAGGVSYGVYDYTASAASNTNISGNTITSGTAGAGGKSVNSTAGVIGISDLMN